MSAGLTMPFSTRSDSSALTRSAMSDGMACAVCRGCAPSTGDCAIAVVGANAAAPSAARLKNPRRPTLSDDFSAMNDSVRAPAYARTGVQEKSHEVCDRRGSSCLRGAQLLIALTALFERVA